jgi:hypothetical protein
MTAVADGPERGAVGNAVSLCELATLGGVALLIDVTGIALAAAGILSPLIAVLVRAGADVAFILNSSRLATD